MSYLKAIRKFVRKNLMNVLVLSAVFLGSLMGIILDKVKRGPYTTREIMYVRFPGDILLNMIKCATLPVMIPCLIFAVSSLEMEISKQIGWQIALYIVLTKIEAGILAILIAYVIRPGAGVYNGSHSDNAYRIENITTTDRFLDLVRNMFPANLVDMHIRLYETVLVRPENGSDDLYDWDVKEGGIMMNCVNLLGIVNYTVIFGAALASLHEESRPLIDIIKSLSQLAMKFTTWILRVTPIMLMFEIAAIAIKMRFHANILEHLGLYIISVTLGHLVQCSVVYPIIYYLLVWKNPFTLMRQFLGAIMTAYATSSSMATMPMSLTILEHRAKIDRRLVRFVIPLAHAINMDGAAIHMGVSTIFIAQLNDIDLCFASIVAVVFLGGAASVAAAGIPHSSIVVIVMILNGVGLPVEDVGLLLSIDWLLDRTDTVTNVFGDAILVGILAVRNRKLLEPIEPIESDASMEDISDK